MKAETLEVFIVDATYDRDDSFKSSSLLRKKFELISGSPLKEENIGSGADLPAFLLEYSTFIPFLALFFMGKQINENLSAWMDIIKKMQALSDEATVYFNRWAAALWGIYKANLSSKDITLISYKSFNRRIDDICHLESHFQSFLIEVNAPYQDVSDVTHEFLIKMANGSILRISVYGDNVNVIEYSSIPSE
jgi:hypothetical protein